VSVGEALTQARLRAGLTVDELSERTRIRKTVIGHIEQDDYDACGGDVFVRGYVRAIAGAVGIDARPLISEYNQTRADTSRDRDRDTHITHVARIADQVPAAADAADVADAADQVPLSADLAAGAGNHPRAADPDATVSDLPVVEAGLGATAIDATAIDRAVPAVPPADPDATRYDLPFVSEDPTPTVSDLPVVPAEPPPPPMPWEPPKPTRAEVPAGWAAESPRTRSRPGRPKRPRQPQRHESESRSRGERRMARLAVPAVLVLAVAGVAIGFAATSGSTPAGQNAALTQRPSHAAGGPLGSGKSAAAKTSAPASPGTSASPTASPTPTTSTPSASVPVTSLHISSAQAFGPQGLSDGDNPQVAQSVIGGGGAQGPWSSQWYATAQFGNLKQGTGLLIDMGHSVTVTSVRINLASYGGANLQLRVGDPAGGPSGMKVAAGASDVGGTVRLRLASPQYVRYLLIWFTLLPPNGAGQYQATVYHVVVNGRI